MHRVVHLQTRHGDVLGRDISTIVERERLSEGRAATMKVVFLM
jgi:hypothetical protein